MSAMDLGKVQVFRCPNCQEFINTSLTECSFCHATVDVQAAQMAADAQGHAAQAYSDASVLKIMARAFLTLYLLSWIPIIGGFAGWGAFFLSIAVPIMFLRWWKKHASVQSADPDYPKAKKMSFVAMAFWGGTMVLWFILFIVQSVLLAAFRQS